MKNIFLINAHEYYPFAEGKLNAALVERATDFLQGAGFDLQFTRMSDDWDVETEIEKHRWADAILLQTPVNWMGVPWSFKKYMDHVYSAGMDGRLCAGDGRTRQDPDTVAIRALNEKLHNDERVDLSMVPIGDGITLLRKR